MVVKYGPHGTLLACPWISRVPQYETIFGKDRYSMSKMFGEIVIRKNKKGKTLLWMSHILNASLCHGRNRLRNIVRNVAARWSKKGNKLACMDKQCGFSKSMPKKNRRINSVKEDTERADGTVRIVMSAFF